MAQLTVLFCGGGSLGHVLPSIAVADAIKAKRPDAVFHAVVSARPDEREAFTAAGIQSDAVSAGKFPRGLSIRWITFPILFVVAFFQSLSILRRVQPTVVFSKGGFVSVPVCLAAKTLGIRIVLHTSDAVLNLSDKLIGRFASEIFTGFPTDAFPASFRGKSVQTGNPVRPFVQRGSRDAGIRITGFSGRRPVVLVMGGSQGALSVNQEIDRIFTELLDLADVIHLTGEGKGLSKTHARYFARPFVTDELPNLYALADVVVTRAGAGALSELALLRKPCIVIPLQGVAHDHQVRNAEVLASLGAIDLLRQAEIANLLPHIRALLASPEQRKTLAEKLQTALPANAAAAIASRVVDAAR